MTLPLPRIRSDRVREKEQRRSQGDSELPQPGREEQDDEEEDQ